jgi:hypothetical protein
VARQYAPALSKQEFKQRRPQGSYQAYLSFLSRNRPGWKPPQAAQPQHLAPPMRGPLPNYESLLRRVQILSPQQMEAQANRMAKTQLGYQRSVYADEYKQAADDALKRMQAQAAAGNAAAAMNASLIGQVGSQYQAGADQLNAMAAGGAGMMAGATTADVAAANNALGNVGAPALSIGGPVGAPGIAGDTQAGVEGYRGGTLPAQAMGTAGGYAQAGMAGQISSQNLRATQEAQAAYQQALADAQKNRTAAVKELVQGRPQVAMQFLQQLQDNQRQAIALAQGLVGASFEKGMTTKKFGQDVRQQGVANQQWAAEFQQNTQQFNAKLAAEAQKNAIEMNRIDASASRAWGYLVDKTGKPILGKDGKPVPVAKSSRGTTGRKFTPGQLSSLIGKAQNTAEEMFYGYGVQNGKRVPVTQLGTFDPNDASTYGTGNLEYAPALGRLTRMGVPKGTAKAILDQYYERGDSGRPVFDPSEEKALKRQLGAKKLTWAKNQIADLLKRGQTAAADALINEVLNGGKGIAWVGK